MNVPRVKVKFLPTFITDVILLPSDNANLPAVSVKSPPTFNVEALFLDIFNVPVRPVDVIVKSPLIVVSAYPRSIEFICSGQFHMKFPNA